MTKFYWFLGDEQFQPEDLVKQAKLAELEGFDGVMVSEHLQPWVFDAGASGFALSTLGAIAASTSSIRLMTGVITPLFRYHPAIVAQAAATLDRLSAGRFELGIGSGENINEAPLGFKLPNYNERSERIKEAIGIMQGLLAGESVNHSGAYYQVNNLKLHSPPINKVPILLAADGPKSASTAASMCDGIITSVKQIDETKANIQGSIKSSNKPDFRLVASRWSVFASNDDEAWQALLPWRGLRAPSRAVLSDPAELQKEADSLPKAAILERYNRISQVSDFIEIYSPLVNDLHAETVCFQVTSINQLETIKLVGREVLPKLRKL